jgi:hypothetical protein
MTSIGLITMAIYKEMEIAIVISPMLVIVSSYYFVVIGFNDRYSWPFIVTVGMKSTTGKSIFGYIVYFF